MWWVVLEGMVGAFFFGGSRTSEFRPDCPAAAHKDASIPRNAPTTKMRGARSPRGASTHPAVATLKRYPRPADPVHRQRTTGVVVAVGGHGAFKDLVQIGVGRPELIQCCVLGNDCAFLGPNGVAAPG